MGPGGGGRGSGVCVCVCVYECDGSWKMGQKHQLVLTE